MAVQGIMEMAVRFWRGLLVGLMGHVDTVFDSIQRAIAIRARQHRVIFENLDIVVRTGQHVVGRRGLGHSSNVEPRDAAGEELCESIICGVETSVYRIVALQRISIQSLHMIKGLEGGLRWILS